MVEKNAKPQRAQFTASVNGKHVAGNTNMACNVSSSDSGKRRSVSHNVPICCEIKDPEK